MDNLILSNQPFFLEGTAIGRGACLLLHGLGGGVYELQLLGFYLHQQGWTVKGINYPGHDQPIEKMPDSRWEKWYDYVQETYHELTDKYLYVSIIGFSTGCLLGLHLAAAYPIQKLVLLSPYISLKYKWYYMLPSEIYLLLFGYIVKHVSQAQKPIQEQSMRKKAEEIAFLKNINLLSVRRTMQLISLVKNELSEIKVPTLIIQSLKDSVVNPDGAKFIFKKLGSTTKEIHWLSKSDHLITLDYEKEEVLLCVNSFLSKEI